MSSNVTATGRIFLRRRLKLESPRRRPWNHSNSHWRKRLHPEIQKSRPSNWRPPDFFNYYRVSGPKTVPKTGKNLKLKLTVSIASVLTGGYCTPDCTEDIFITLRVFNAKSIPNSPSPCYSIFAQIVALPYPEMDMRCEDFLVTLRLGMLTNLTYHTALGEGVIENFFDKITPKRQQYTVPNYHFINCIKCQNQSFQIGYEVVTGPVFARLLYLHKHFDTASLRARTLGYRLVKKAYAINSEQEVGLTHDPFIIDIEVLKVCYYEDEPTYCMVIGKIVYSYLSPRNPQPSYVYQTEDPTQSDERLLAPGNYVHIDHWDNHELVEGNSVLPFSVFELGAERAYINYVIGPNTARIGSFPFFPRRKGNERKL